MWNAPGLGVRGLRNPGFRVNSPPKPMRSHVEMQGFQRRLPDLKAVDLLRPTGCKDVTFCFFCSGLMG